MSRKQNKLYSFKDKSISEIKNELSDQLNNIPFHDRRIIYELLVDSSLKNNPSNHFKKKIGESKKNSKFNNKINDCDISEQFKKLSTYPSNLGNEVIWSLYEEVFTGKHAKNFGQYFTPNRVVRLAISALSPNTKDILDPMSGHGIFLRLAREEFPISNITGVEIDPILTKTSKLITNDDVNVINADVFEWALNSVKNNKDFNFSSIIGNPAYVSYQKLQNIIQFSDKSPNNLNYREILLNTLKSIANIKGLNSEIFTLFDNWSGYSDLSSYALILSWLLTDRNGEISFVMSNHWMKRDYGSPIRKFLANRGDIRCIISHQNVNWFSPAQIPTSIVVISKGKRTEPQNKEIPYIEIKDSRTKDSDNLKSYLDSILNQDFWRWVDSLEKPIEGNSLNVSFLNWHETSSDQRTFNTNKSPDLDLPQYIGNLTLSSFKEEGWHVHQGLRTGCNEVFYVYKEQEKKDEYICYLTEDGKKQKISLKIPEEFLLPSIQKLPNKAPLKLDDSSINAYLLDLRNAVTPKHKKEITNKYPSEWLDHWGFNDLKIIPTELAEHLSYCGGMTYEKSPKKNKVKELSTVKPNIRRPKLKSSKNIPDPPRFWYQLPLNPRHFGDIIIPRVNDGPLRTHLLDNKENIVTDANFVTLISESECLQKEKLWAWLNSNTFRLICELNGITMGGGALKVETTLVSKIPIPITHLDKEDNLIPPEMKKNAKKTLKDNKILEFGSKIDSYLFNEEISNKNKNMLENLINLRQNRSKRS